MHRITRVDSSLIGTGIDNLVGDKMSRESGAHGTGNSAATIAANCSTATTHASNTENERSEMSEQPEDAISTTHTTVSKGDGSHAASSASHVEHDIENGKGRETDESIFPPQAKESSTSSSSSTSSLESTAQATSAQSQRNGETGSETSATDKTISSEQTETDETGEDSDSKASPKRKGGITKEERAKLRKGKWTAEEEEYTSRIIHYFSTGILTLPESTTLRSYLAEKLNCDPMRITKKYAGASCLGKRVYHLCDRSPATVADVEIAKAELATLEHRFHLRVEHGQSGVPLPARTDFMPSNALAGGQPAWLAQSFATLSASASGGFQMPQPLATSSAAGLAGAWPAASSPWFAPNTLLPTVCQALPALSANAPNEVLATWAWAQAAACLTPALSQLAAANLQQQQHQLLKAYEAQIQAIAQQSFTGSSPAAASAHPTVAPPKAQANHATRVSSIKASAAQGAANSRSDGTKVATKGDANPSDDSHLRSKEDQDAGSMLMGFLSTLRKAYEDALKETVSNEKKQSSTLSGRKRQARDEKPPASKKPRDAAAEHIRNTVAPSSSTAPSSVPDASYMSKAETSSGTTSYPADSSLEDSESSETDKGKDPSSSEDSDKDSSGDRGSSGERGFGPPRKRMKGKHMVGRFTRKNVAKHNYRMDAMRGRINPSQDLPERDGLEE